MLNRKPRIKCTVYGGKIGWYLRKHFSNITSNAYLKWQYQVRKQLFNTYIREFWKHYSENQILPPCLISIETINRCNGVCSFCPANKNAESRPFQKMDKFLFYKIIDDLKGMKYDGYLNLYVNNEPFMDTRIEDWYIYAKQQLPDAKMLLYTNGTLLTKERFERVIPVIDKCIINNYSDTLVLQENIKEILHLVKNDHKYWDKDITVQIRYCKEILTNRAGSAPNKSQKARNHMLCIMPFTDLTIYPNGNIGLCCSDALEKTNYGNLKEKSVAEIWTGEEFYMLRELIGKDRSRYFFCKGCDFVDAGIRNDFMKRVLRNEYTKGSKKI